MAPSGRTKITTARGRKPRRRSHLKKTQSQKKCIDFDASSIDSEVAEVSSSSACSTPKGQNYRIPEVLTCPPAPKKEPRLLSNNCSLHISPLALFAPPLAV
ncbi:hypothetical protein Lal_00048708 [Lupinus albus]|uniref:Uncharacterized protein n=1 Tax=Lupinus albus TaxID=3870 RepID=A0A6A4PBE0_LUPAL|nr:hypothetical protein Lalb_Chr17g0349061 [Lupinus albus]KAF1864143.1 hypothetical protein Lal_00048708 [Lupinus albus]